MVAVRGEESSTGHADKMAPQVGARGNEDAVLNESAGQNGTSLPDLVSRPLQLDVGLREVTLTPGLTLEISLQQDLVMTVRVKPDKHCADIQQLNPDFNGMDGKAVIEISDREKTVSENEPRNGQSLKSIDEISAQSTILENDLVKETDSPSEDGESQEQSTNLLDETALKDVSNVSKDLTNSLDEELIRMNDETKEPTTIDQAPVEIDVTETDRLNNAQDAETSSSDSEEWTTQNVQSSFRPDYADLTEDDEWGEIFEDCQDYEEIVTDFGCDYFSSQYSVRESQLQTIIEEEEEDEEESSEEEEEEEDESTSSLEREQVVIEDLDKNDNDDKIGDILSLMGARVNEMFEVNPDTDSDVEKSELEQFEILEQLCSSSSDDFDAEEFCKVNTLSNNTNKLNTKSIVGEDPQEQSHVDKSTLENDRSFSEQSNSENVERISSFKEYLKRKNSFGSKGEYVNKLTLIQENDGRSKVLPVCEQDKFKEEVTFDQTTLNAKAPSTTKIENDATNPSNSFNDDNCQKPSNEESYGDDSSDRYALTQKNIGALNSILRSKLADKSISNNNFESEITLKGIEVNENILNENSLKSILKNKSVINDDKSTVLKSILKTREPQSNCIDVDEDSLNGSISSVNFTDSLNSTLDDMSDSANASHLADVSCDSSYVDDVMLRYSKDRRESGDDDPSFEWRETDNSLCDDDAMVEQDIFDDYDCDASPVKKIRISVGQRKKCVSFDCGEDLNGEAGTKRGMTSGRSPSCLRRMAQMDVIDPETKQPQVNIFSTSEDLYDFGSDPWFSCRSTPDRTSMRTKKDKGSSSSSKESEQSSSTDSNPALPKSALKRPGKKRKKHKVQFDESLNKFFEADYVILIREDECECGGELCCSSFLQEDEDEDSFADLEEEESSCVEIPEPPIEFVDQLTLSPPDGYKDTCLPDTINFQQQHDGLTCGDEIKSCEDHTTQTTPTSPTLPHSLESLSQGEDDRNPNDYSTTGTSTGQINNGAGNSANTATDRYIVETITMTTVTERRIVRETLESSHVQPSREELSLRLVRPCTMTKPGSAVRALFPSAVRSPDSEDDTDPLESSLIKRTIERNTLRRSLLKYPGDLRLRRKKQQVSNEESLEEKIRKLTCDIDQEPEQEQRTSPQGQEEQCSSLPQPTYSVSRRLCEVLRKEQHPVALEQQYPSYYESASFLATAAAGGRIPGCGEHHRPMSAVDMRPPSDLRLMESRPLSAEPPGARDSIATDYSLGDIDEVLGDCSRQISSAVDCRPGDGRPDVLAGTPDPPDELALFVEQDASRIERIRKRYSNSEEESDDYGFSRRPSVRGIKPTFGSTTEILQRMQSQVGPGWPYYPQTSGLNGCRPGTLTPAPSIRPIAPCQPLCAGSQPTAICPQPPSAVMTAYPQHHPVGAYQPTAYLPYSTNGYPPRLYARHDMPLVRATQTPPHYYPRYRVGSPTKGKIEGRIGPEGAASSSHDISSCDDISHRDIHSSSASLRDIQLRDPLVSQSGGIRDMATTPPQNLHDASSIDSSLMYAMNV